MAKLKNLIILAHTLIEGQLIPSGWRRRSQGLYTLEMGGDVIGWLGLTRATRTTGGLLLINPVVGVRNQVLERLVAQLCGAKFHQYIPACICANVGYLMPRERFVEWPFSPDEDPEPVARDLVQTVLDYGLPFMRANVDLKQLLNTMLFSRFGVTHLLRYRVPVAYMILGQIDTAKSALDKYLTEMADATYPSAVAYMEFATAFREVLDRMDQ